MILTFSRDTFVAAIKDGTKKHTIRKDRGNRWKPGANIHFWRNNPRNVKLNPYQFGTGKCIDVANIEIYPATDRVKISQDGRKYETLADMDSLNALAVNDGFRDWQEMKQWFTEDFTGKMIFWGQFSNV